MFSRHPEINQLLAEKYELRDKLECADPFNIDSPELLNDLDRLEKINTYLSEIRNSRKDLEIKQEFI